jgi:ADP-heptose:LPS heptosyltransferase
VDKEKILYFCTSLTSTFVNAFKRKPQSVESILIVKLDEIGDMLYTLHCIGAVRELYPKADISILCKSMNNILVDRIAGAKCIINDHKQLDGYYDIQIDFRGDWNSLKRVWKGKCGYYLDRGSIRLQNKFNGGQKHEVETNQDTIQSLFSDDYKWDVNPLNISEESIGSAKRIITEYGLSEYVVMHCGARDEERRWPTDRFASLIDSIYKEYGLKTILIGAQNETELNEAVLSKTEHAINLAGKTNLLELAAIIRKSKLFVGNESGPLHFAILDEKPLVGLFGPGVQGVFYPLYPNQRVIHHVIDKQSIEDKQASMLLIKQQEVLDAVGELSL